MWPDELQQWATALIGDEVAVRALMRRAGGDRERIAEALQKALLCAPRLYERMQERTYAAFRAWMVWKADRLLIDEFRRWQQRISRLSEESEEQGPAVRDDDAARRVADLREAVARYPDPDVRRLLELRMQGYTLEEIAQREGTYAGAIHRRLQEPLRVLRQWLIETDADLFRGLQEGGP